MFLGKFLSAEETFGASPAVVEEINEHSPVNKEPATLFLCIIFRVYFLFCRFQEEVNYTINT